MEGITVYEEPTLRSPKMIAAWPGMGNVALGAANYLCTQLNARLFAEIEPSSFFSPTDVQIRDNLIELPRPPRSRFFYWNGDPGDLVILLAEAQPRPDMEYPLAEKVLEVARYLDVNRVYTFAAAPTHISHTDKPKVLGVPNKPELISELEGHNVTLMGEGSISGMNGLLLGVAREKGIEGLCLLGELPIYAVKIDNPRSSQAVLEVLREMLDVPLDMTDIDELAKRTEGAIDKYLEQLTSSEQVTDEYVQSVFDAETVPESAKDRIEKLFQEAKKDRSKAEELKTELDKWGLFEKYQDRFLDLFRSGDN